MPKFVRHKQRGTTYEVLGEGMLQCKSPLPDDTPVVIYRDTATGQLWARGRAEFSDGRFEEWQSRPPVGTSKKLVKDEK